MISSLVLALHGRRSSAATPGEAVRTLSSLVPAVVEGIVRDVSLVVAPPNPDLALVADHAGCGLIEDDGARAAIEAAARQCRVEDVLVISAGVIVDRALLEEVARLVSSDGGGRPTAYLVKAADVRWVGQAFASLATTVGVLTKRDLIAAARAESLTQLVRGLRTTRRLKTRAWTGD